ncbi:MAG: signal peptide peptidase SppA [Flavobacteriaceae bacterium]|nr:signal peptide peptidase SppA [Flavobacteriaceae bacterium]
MDFLKRVLSTITGLIIFCIILFLLFIIVGVALGSNSDNVVDVKNNSVLELKLNFPVQDYADPTVFKDFPSLDDTKKDGLFNIINAIDYAAIDDKIKGISIDNTITVAGVAQIQALRDALLRFKSSGKFITAYGDIYTQKDYYLSSVADTIFVNPAAIFEFKGLSTERFYYKDFEDKTGVKMEVIKLGKYKSAVEPYLLNEMSDENREQITIYLNSIWSTMRSQIAKSRGLSEHQIDTIAGNLLARNATLAVASQLADKAVYHDEYLNMLKNALGISKSEELNTINITDYAEHADLEIALNTRSKNRIAVIYAEGEIIYGKGNKDYIGDGVMNDAIREAREDERIKAVVLRINSPGGSALASELIWREIELTKQVKPVIVSMGNVAASGGYYIACNADRIVAEASTITGSIGVFGMLPNVKGLADNIGINAEQVTTHKNAMTYSFLEPLSENQRTYFMNGIYDVYDLFTRRVAVGRGMTQDRVKEIGEGRVYTGLDALEIGLIDEIGGLDVALEYAAKVAEIEEYRIEEYPVFEMNFDEIFENFGWIKSDETLLREKFGDQVYETLSTIKSATQRKGIQLMTVYPTTIK